MSTVSRPSASAPAQADAAGSVLVAVRALSDSLDRMHSGLKGAMDMNSTDLAALRMLIVREQRGESVSPHDMARHLRISTASTTKLLDRLASAGYVERRPHPSDRRARVIVLTDECRAAFFRHFRGTLDVMREVATRYSDEELDIVSDFMLAMADAIDPR